MTHPDPIEVQVARRLEGGWIPNKGEQPVDNDVRVDTLWGDGDVIPSYRADYWEWQVPFQVDFNDNPLFSETIYYWRPAR